MNRLERRLVALERRQETRYGAVTVCGLEYFYGDRSAVYRIAPADVRRYTLVDFYLDNGLRAPSGQSDH